MQQNQEPKRQYFFVSQSEPLELNENFLWADDVNTTNAFKKMIREVKNDDIIIQYSGSEGYSRGNGGSIIGIAVACSDNYPYKNPHPNSKYGEEGHRVDVKSFRFATPVPKKDVFQDLYDCQPDKYGRFNIKGNVKEGYLAKANEATAQIILAKALEIDRSPEQKKSVERIQEAIGMEALSASTRKDKNESESRQCLPFQKIFFGAPGTGKSWRINNALFKVDGKESGLKDIPGDRKFRTTFHPDYDYAQFVGAYKPMKEGDKITYSFVPQVFAEAYAKAWVLWLKNDEDKAKDKNVYLVIEEINRGNCAQIFGDIFQLLDRDSEGFSEYIINADRDFAGWLNDELMFKEALPAYMDKVGGGKLKLPPNLNILATMNTSDQSLFPMDSAFKRRFDWEYVPISFADKEAADYQIDIGGTLSPWQGFAEKVNAKVLELTESEDKQLGEFFIKPDKDGGVISKDRFLGKVMFYLWNEVCKDEHKHGSFFRMKGGKYFTFQDLYKSQDTLGEFIKWLDADANGDTGSTND